jgi:hypothetical protein
MKPGELRKFFSRVPRPAHDLSDKPFLIVDNRGSAVDIMMDGVICKDMSSLFISSFSEVIDETR